ncbi:putative leucine-rich repeat receptor-like serine/threonine-protein kinase At2g14440 [Dendrobium catenatum]|uniref:putative leucine-rich repeat receptor-like serine/threonine-protein kinase At2g14440 n=1 Tax=Dendrobium catenatum TaxID=906689 RepID=UPI0009F6FCD6|nr:putative leucine-rich repeat receptor-like serine/threonine-protein kinase At2g14440 [Dendrobium catenatum]
MTPVFSVASSFFLIFFLFRLAVFPLAIAAPPPRGYYINCGAATEENIDGIPWIPDEGFVIGGNVSQIYTPGIIPLLSTLRYFPDTKARKSCFVIQVSKGSKYMVRTTYFYGGFDGGEEPPVFDQIIDGTRWSTVETSKNYAAGLTSYYEIMVAAQRKTISVCLARNANTASASSPFISALEVVSLENSMYNSTNFAEYALSTIARHSFGHKNSFISYPDDPFNRYWQSFIDTNPVVECHSNISSSDFWNFPPPAALMKGLTTSRGKDLHINWPPFDIPDTSYYIALYFQDNRTPSPFSWRVFDVVINGKTFYQDLNVSTEGVMVYGSQWPLSGETNIKLTPASDSPVGPVINAGEIFQIVPLGGRTLARDVIAMENIARSFTNPPPDWKGDPCLPKENSWAGVTCDINGGFAIVAKLNLTNFGISGHLSNSIGNLLAIRNIWLSGNKLAGKIPQMGNLKELTSLRLADNELTGSIPSFLANLPKIKEIFLQKNKLSGPIPQSLKNKSGIDLRISPGNQLEM